MSTPPSCTNCGKSSFERDDDTGDLVCSSCGVLQPYDQYEAQIGGINGPKGTYIHVGSAGSGSTYSYRDRKLFKASSCIDELANMLGLESKSLEIKTMISKITEGEFGDGDWFPIMIGACAYVLMRKDQRPLPMAEVASAVDCDVYRLGRMIVRVIEFLDLRRDDFPEFDIVYTLERTLKNSSVFNSVERSLMDRVKKQGIFLIQCSVKWFLSTGRRPLPLVVAVLVLVAEVNEVKIRIDDLAKEVHATVSTCRTRYNELLETLVKAAQVLPWAKDITKKNIVKHAPFVIQYMEKKCMSKPVEKRKKVDQPGLDLGDGLTSKKDSHYFAVGSNDADRAGINDVDRLQKCLSMMYEKFLNETSCANAPKQRGFGQDLQESREWWNGKSELSRKLMLKDLLEKDIGVDTMPPSYVNGQLKFKTRREKISTAKARIRRITHPLDADLGGTGVILDSSCPERRKKRKLMVVDGIDWEDMIIETLILHQVKEEEIEKGHYNTLLDLFFMVWLAGEVSINSNIATDRFKRNFPETRTHVLVTSLLISWSITQYTEIWEIDEKDPLLGPEGGESVKDVASRLAKAMTIIKSEFEGCAILVVSHGDPLQILQTILLAANQQKERTHNDLASTLEAVQVVPVLSHHRKYALETGELRGVI